MALNAAAAASTGMTYQFTTAGAGTDPITGLYCQMLAGTTTTGQAAALNLENNTTGAESIGGRMVVSGAATDNIGLLLSASNGTDQNMAFSAVSTLPVASSDTIVQAVKIEATTGGTSATCEPHTFYGTLGGTFTSAKDSHGMQFVNNVTNTGGGFTEGARFCTYTIANSCNKGLDLYAANGVKNYGFISTAESPSYGSCTDNYGGILIARNATVTNEAVRATSTLAAAAGSPVQGHYFKTTAAGSAKHWQRGIYSELADGYSGSGTTAAIYANNLNVNEGTGTDIGLLCEGNDYALHASSLGVGDGNILVDGSATIGGGYGSTGVTISATGNIQADGVLTIDGAATLNNDGGDADVTIKGQTDDNLLWTDASVDQVLIGTTGLAAPYFQAEKLEAFETLSGNSKVAYSFAADLGTSCTGGNYQSNLGVRCKATTTTVDTYYYSGDIECVMSADCTEGHGIGSYSSASVAAGGKVQTLHGIEAFAYTEGTGVSNAAVDTCASAYFHGPVKGEAGDTLTNAYAAYFAAPTHGDTLNYSIRAAGDVLFEGEIEGKAAYFDGCENNGAASTQYLDMNNGTIMAANRGYPMMRDGSITGVAGLVTVAGYAGAGTCEIQARISGSEVFKTSITIDGNGKKTNQTTQARGTDTFSAGDSLEIYFEKTSGTYSAGYPTGIIEVIYDD